MTTENKYAAMVARLAKDPETILSELTADKVDLWHAATGIAGESGEILDIVKKFVVNGNDENFFDKIVKEMGDVEFYMQQLRAALEISRDEVLQANINKLAARFPEGYSDAAAKDRADVASDPSELSNKGLGLLRELEGCRLSPYDDSTGKDISEWCEGATIGYGYLIPKSEWWEFDAGISGAHARGLLRKSLLSSEEVVAECALLGLGLKQSQFDALVILAYNIGRTGYKDSSVVKILTGQEGSNYPDLSSAWSAWNKDRGVVVDGLVNRREKELQLYLTGAYAV